MKSEENTDRESRERKRSIISLIANKAIKTDSERGLKNDSGGFFESKINGEETSKSNKKNALLMRRSSLMNINDGFQVPDLYVTTAKRSLYEREPNINAPSAITNKQHGKLHSDNQNSNISPTIPLSSLKRGASSNTNYSQTQGNAPAGTQKGHKQTTAEQIMERYGVEILSPGAKISWKSKTNRGVSPLLSVPFERTNVRRKTLDTGLRKVNRRNSLANVEKNQSLASIPDQSARIQKKVENKA